nr:hypothetical protein [Pandoravirus massiliensis]
MSFFPLAKEKGLGQRGRLGQFSPLFFVWRSRERERERERKNHWRTHSLFFSLERKKKGCFASAFSSLCLWIVDARSLSVAMFARAYLASHSGASPRRDSRADLERGHCVDSIGDNNIGSNDDKATTRYNPSLASVIMARAYSIFAIVPWLFGLALCVVLDGVAAVAAVFGAVLILAALVFLAVSVVVAAPAWGPVLWRWRRAWIDPAPPV